MPARPRHGLDGTHVKRARLNPTGRHHGDPHGQLRRLDERAVSVGGEIGEAGLLELRPGHTAGEGGAGA